MNCLNLSSMMYVCFFLPLFYSFEVTLQIVKNINLGLFSFMFVLFQNFLSFIEIRCVCFRYLYTSDTLINIRITEIFNCRGNHKF